jgi:[ribosomal protein S18]-alanine N-acetyltransferase
MTLLKGLRIRSMSESDIDAVLALERQSDGVPHWAAYEYLRAIQIDSGPYFKRDAMVAVFDGEVVGFAVSRVVGGAGDAEAELESIVVAVPWRGRGVGMSLLAEVAEVAKVYRVSRLALEVRASNEAAIRLYRRAGFLETGWRRGYYSNPDEDAVLMSVIL